jgi:hypothetical protein
MSLVQWYNNSPGSCTKRDMVIAAGSSGGLCPRLKDGNWGWLGSAKDVVDGGSDSVIGALGIVAPT